MPQPDRPARNLGNPCILQRTETRHSSGLRGQSPGAGHEKGGSAHTQSGAVGALSLGRPPW